jgi:DNA-binding transcriptional LysR family regulator
LRELRGFVAVVDEGALSAAARRMHLSQPALSQMVTGLERELGLQLLVRSTSGVRPTEAGRTLYTEARAVLDRYDLAMAAMTRHSSGADQVLRIGVPLELPPELLSTALAGLVAAYPTTRAQVVHLSTAAQLSALRADQLDLGLLREHPIGPEFDAVPVVEEPLGSCWPATMPLTSPDPRASDWTRWPGWTGSASRAATARPGMTSSLRSCAATAWIPATSPPKGRASSLR